MKIHVHVLVSTSPVHVNPLGGESDAHVTVAALGDDGHLEVVDSAGGGDGVRGAHRARVLVGLAVPAVLHAQVALRQPYEVVLVLVRPRPDRWRNYSQELSGRVSGAWGPFFGFISYDQCSRDQTAMTFSKKSISLPNVTLTNCNL